MFAIPSERLQRSRLDSGMEVVTVEMPGFQTVAVGLFTHVGSRAEGPGQEGFSHFVEHMLFKDTARFRTSELTEGIEKTGSSVGAYTSEESVCVHARTFPHAFADVMEILLEMHTTPAFNPEELDLEREVILEEIASNDDQPALLVADTYSAVLYGSHPLGHPIMGRPEGLHTIRRDDLLHHFYRYFVSGNMVLSAAGAITHEQLFDWALVHEAAFRRGERSSFLPYEGEENAFPVLLLPRTTEQCHLQFGVRCFGRHDRRCWSLRVLSALLGESMSSRLFQRVREERGLAYQISTDFELFEETGTFYVQCNLEPEKVGECLKVCLDELHSVANGHLSDSEVERGKAYVIGHVIQELESTEATMLWFGDKAIARDQWMQTHELIEAVGEVSREEVAALCRELFEKGKLRAALVGPLPKRLDLKNVIHDQLRK